MVGPRLIVAILAATLAAEAASQQPGEAVPRSTMRYSGALTAEGSAGSLSTSAADALPAGASIDGAPGPTFSSENMIVPNNYELTLAAGETEAIVVQLLAGDVQNQGGDPVPGQIGVWVIRPGSSQVLKTEDDSAILRITRLNRPGE
jgi:hypothetical protein